MKVEIKVPAMGESIAEATISELIKHSGESVAVDDEVLELETDKVNQVLYAPESGVLTLSVEPGQTVAIGDVIGYVDTEGTPAAAAPPPPEEETKPPPPKEEPKPPPLKEEPKSPPPEEKPRRPAPLVPPPSGQGRVGKEEFFKRELPSTPTPASSSRPSTSQKETRKPMTRIRKVIAKRLVEAQLTTAMLTTFNEIDMSTVMELRSRFKDSFQEKWGVKLGFMSFFVKACVSALKAVPQLNSYIDEEEIVERHTYDMGIAVGTERGLVVPVVRNCDQLSFAQVEQEIVNYATKAREGGLSMDDLQGGGFTITNGGVYGSLLSTPILNMPQSGILGMHKIEKRAVVVNDKVVIRPMMYVALSYDHRIVDGKEAVTFLVHIKECLENPTRLLFEEAEL